MSRAFSSASFADIPCFTYFSVSLAICASYFPIMSALFVIFMYDFSYPDIIFVSIVSTEASKAESPRTIPVTQSTTLRIHPLLPFMVSISSSHADDKHFNEPAILSDITSAIDCNSPSTPVICSLSGTILSADVRNALNADTLRLSVSSSVVLRSTPLSLNLTSPFTRSGNVLTGSPNVFASLPLLSARLSRMLRVAVAAIDASNPASESFPNNANVSSMVKLNDLATGPTIGIAVAR